MERMISCQWGCTGSVIGSICGLEMSLFLFYERGCQQSIYICSRHSSADLQQLLQQLLQPLFHIHILFHLLFHLRMQNSLL
jgi:hypothetical protein